APRPRRGRRRRAPRRRRRGPDLARGARRPRRPCGRRRQAGEDPAYGRRGQPARRPDRRAGLRRRRDTVRRRHAVRPDSGVRPERRARRAAGLSWTRRHHVLHARRQHRLRGERGACPVSEPLTREEALRRLLAGGAALTIPGLVPAVARAATQADPKLGKTLTISNWVLYIDVNEKTKKRPTIE